MSEQENMQGVSSALSSTNLAYTGNIANDFSQKEAMLAAYEEAIQLYPYEARFHYHKGLLLEQLGRLSEAQRSFDEAQRLGYNA